MNSSSKLMNYSNNFMNCSGNLTNNLMNTSTHLQMNRTLSSISQHSFRKGLNICSKSKCKM